MVAGKSSLLYGDQLLLGLQDCLTNTTFHDLFPQLKMIIMYEHEKVYLSCPS